MPQLKMHLANYPSLRAAGHSIVFALQMTVQEHDQSHGCSVRVTLSICQDLRNIEHLKSANNGCDQCICQNWTDQRQCNIEESLDTVTSIQVRCLEDVLTDSHDCCHQHNSCISKPHQEVHKSDQRSCSKYRSKEIDRFFQDSD